MDANCKLQRAGSESDFGMRTGSRIKLLKTSTIKLSESIPTAIPVRTLARTETATRPDSLRSYDIQFFPEDINQYFFISFLIEKIYRGNGCRKSYS